MRAQSGLVVSVASGKGGTGKTTVALSLARVAADRTRAQVLDCDVEEPNCHLFVQPSFRVEEEVGILTPSVNMNTCSRCGLCAEVCAFHAILASKLGVLVLPELCHGCGACAALCPTNSITEVARTIGRTRTGNSLALGGDAFGDGILNPGDALATPVIEAVRHGASADAGLTIIDSPPGTSCPMVHSVKGTDYCILVTEPTPLGLHDLELAWETTRVLGIPSGVVINRSGLTGTDVAGFCRDRNIAVLMEIPSDRRIATSYAKGRVLVDALPEYRDRFLGVVERLLSMRVEKA